MREEPGLLDQALDAMIEGDHDRAERLVRLRLDQVPGDPDALALQVELLAFRDGTEAPEGPSEVVPFRCVACGNMAHDVREILLNTRGFTFLGWDALNRGADCHICRTCGYVHWFLEPSPGGYQAMHPRRRDAETLLGDEVSGGCMVCGFDTCYSRAQLLNTRGLSFLGLEFLNQQTNALVCVRCGHMHWHLAHVDAFSLDRQDKLPPEPPLRVPAAKAARDVCRNCGGARLFARKALLNSRMATHFGFDWLNQGAFAVECGDCHFLAWYASTAV